MSQLLPEGTLRRRIVETIDRSLGFVIFGSYRTLSSQCGDRLKDETAGAGCKCLCRALDGVEKGHCLKNAGKL